VDLSDYHEELTSAVLDYDGLTPSDEKRDNASVLLANISGVMPIEGMTPAQIKPLTQVKDGSVSKALKDLVTRGERDSGGTDERERQVLSPGITRGP
jgi:hypothetical protein